MNSHKSLHSLVLFLGCLGTVVPGIADAASEDCTLKRVASIPADFRDDRILLAVSVDGNPVRFLLDTGSRANAVSQALGARLGLIQQMRNRSQVAGTDGESRAAGIDGDYGYVRVGVPELKLGNLVIGSAEFSQLPIGGDGSDGRMAGLLGNDILQRYDVELDPTQGSVNLYLQAHCAGRVVYWAKESFELPFTTTPDRDIDIEAVLDDKPLHALVDTGSTEIMLSLGAATGVLDIHSSDPDVHVIGTVSGAIGKPILAYEKTFRTLRLGQLTLRNPQIVLYDSPFAEPRTGTHIRNHLGPPFTIGMSLLGRLHSFIAFSESKIYFTLVPPPSAPPN